MMLNKKKNWLYLTPVALVLSLSTYSYLKPDHSNNQEKPIISTRTKASTLERKVKEETVNNKKSSQNNNSKIKLEKYSSPTYKKSAEARKTHKIVADYFDKIRNGTIRPEQESPPEHEKEIAELYKFNQVPLNFILRKEFELALTNNDYKKAEALIPDVLVNYTADKREFLKERYIGEIISDYDDYLSDLIENHCDADFSSVFSKLLYMDVFMLKYEINEYLELYPKLTQKVETVRELCQDK